MAGGTIALRFALFLYAAAALAACEGTWFGSEEEKEPLPGTRVSVLLHEQGLEPDRRLADLPVWLPRPVLNPDWPQVGGNSAHAMYHLAAGERLERVWRVSVGAGSTSENRLLSPPVAGGGRVYAMGTSARVSAYAAASGERLWRVDVRSEEEREGTMGGGVAYAYDHVFVTTGFGDAVALEASSGKVVWRRTLPGPLRAAPTVAEGRVLVVTVDNQLHALDARDGSVLWTHSGIVETASLLGGASPAVAGDIVVVPYSSGELFALRIENGRVVWSDALSSIRRTDPLSSLAAIRGNPVVDKDLVFAISNSGQMVAIDLRSGRRAWEQAVGGVQDPWVAGEFLYLVTNEGELLCLTRRSGRVRWSLPLPRYEDEEEGEGAILWAGPVLVGDRLVLAGSHGEAIAVSPYTGEPLGRVKLPDPVFVPPIVAGGTVYFLTDDADLVAFR